MPIPYDYITAFLIQVEGRHCRGYIPCHVKATGKGRNYIGPDGADAAGVPYAVRGNPCQFTAMGASGVTIAIGCDLGQTDAATLKAYGASPELIELFRPYLGKRKAAALDALYARPLLITDAQCQDLARAVIHGCIDKQVIPAYDKAAPVPFASLPEQAQAVFTSCCYQKGCAGFRKDWPKLWSCFLARDWTRAEQELRTGFRQYRLRRLAEAEKLYPLTQPRKAG